jgi:ABC-2 type transport system ATP-binding protein
VDIEVRRSMWEFLRDINARGTTIILTTHYLEEAESLCRNIAIIDNGNIIEHEGMANLLLRLHNETFVLNTRNPVSAVPVIENFAVRLIDAHTLEADISKEQNLNELFSQLTVLGIDVLSMRNKVNRLEEIFMRLVNTNAG